jgi:hypothetical protein
MGGSEKLRADGIWGWSGAYLYTINGIHTFNDYVETLAQQWLEWVL